MATQNANQRLKSIDTEEKRRRKFLDSIRKGRIFECVSCHRKLFETGVEVFSDKLIEKVEEKYSNEIENSIGIIKTRMVDGSHYICHTCKGHIMKGKMPKLSHKNNLQMFDDSKYDDLRLTELENCLIALNIPFQKVFKLPKSLWPAMKDKTVNIPLLDSDVMNTVKSLPRTPSEAGIIPVNLKRKTSYKNHHLCQYVSVEKI